MFEMKGNKARIFLVAILSMLFEYLAYIVLSHGLREPVDRLIPI